jgi:hypothetical protein
MKHMKTLKMNNGQNRGRTLGAMLGFGGAVVLFICLVTQPAVRVLRERRISRNETAAVGALRAYCAAQALYHRTDWDGDGTLTYATPFTLLHDQPDEHGLPVQFIHPELAAAAGSDRPCRGYVFKDLRTICGIPIDWMNDYALCAVPLEYGVTGRRTFIVSTNGAIMELDRADATFVSDYPYRPPAWGPIAE